MTDALDLPVFVAGHNGMVGRAIVRHLSAVGYRNIVTRDRRVLDLSNQAAVQDFFDAAKVAQVYLAAARVGGIHANNQYPAEFIYQNLMIQSNVVHAAHRADVQQLLFLGSSCIYPKLAPQPIKESALLTGALEPTNEAYAIAKIAGIRLCQAYSSQYGRDYRSIMPTNMYGPHDNFHSENSHVISGLMIKFDEAIRSGAKTVTVWGSGTAQREFLHVDDMAAAAVHVMQLNTDTNSLSPRESGTHLNVGTGEDCSIRELAETLMAVSGFSGSLVFDTSRPDGTPRKLLDVSALHATGWRHAIDLPDGLESVWAWFQENSCALRRS